jgi:hypothetical protein
MNVSRRNLGLLEAEVVRRFQGIQLVCELGLHTDEPFFRECLEALNGHLQSNDIRSVSVLCPAVYVLVLTTIGAELGTGGELWERILEEGDGGLRLTGLETTNTSKFGEQYRASLMKIGLADFSHVGGMRNLSPILMHSGIPIHSAGVVWRKVQEFVRSGTISGREIVQELRADKTHLKYFNQPAQRFIREAGTFAMDMIQRMVNVILSKMDDPEASSEILGSRHGLPFRFVRVADGELSADNLVSYVVPSAHIYLDLYGGNGPYCLLPPVRERAEKVVWSVCGRNYRASRFDDKRIQLEPAASWSVEAITDGTRLRARVFPSLIDGGAWLFSDTRSGLRLAQTADGVEEGKYFLICPRGLRVRIHRGGADYEAPTAEAAGLGNSWSLHKVLELELEGAESFQLFQIDDGSSLGDPVGVLPAPLQPILLGPECVGIREADGLRVFSAPPELAFIGHGSGNENFTLAVRDPSGTWFETPLLPAEIHNSPVHLVDKFEWKTGQYRVEVVGPMGSGMAETFVVLLDGHLHIEDGLLKPREVVDVGLIFKTDSGSDLLSIPTEFKEYESRKYVEVLDHSLSLALSIPRIAFDIGGVNSPPNFSVSSPRFLAITDLEKPGGQQLHIRTGNPATLHIEATNESGAVVHSDWMTTSGANATGALHIDALLESIRSLGARTTTVELVTPDFERLLILTIQQELDFKIIESNYVIGPDETLGEIEVLVATKTDSSRVKVLIRSLERTWDEPIEVELLARDEESGPRKARSGPVPPGSYSIELAIGANAQSIRSTRRIGKFGDGDQQRRYLASIAEDPTKLAERAVFGEKVSRSELSAMSPDDVNRVVHFFVLRNREFESTSKVFQSILRVIALEGNSRIIAEWITRTGAEVVSTRDLEMFVVRLFSIFIDDPLRPPDAGEDQDLEVDEILASRLWALSPMIGFAFTYRLSIGPVIDRIKNLGVIRPEPNYEILAELTWPALDKRIARSTESDILLSADYAVLHFKKAWKQVWTGAGPDADRLESLEEQVASGRALLNTMFLNGSFELPRVIASSAPEQFRQGRKNENLVIAKFVHHLFRLAWLVARPETPLDAALRASEILGLTYGFAKGLTDRALVLAVMTERSRGLSNV